MTKPTPHDSDTLTDLALTYVGGVMDDLFPRNSEENHTLFTAISKLLSPDAKNEFLSKVRKLILERYVQFDSKKCEELINKLLLNPTTGELDFESVSLCGVQDLFTCLEIHRLMGNFFKDIEDTVDVE